MFKFAKRCPIQLKDIWFKSCENKRWGGGNDFAKQELMSLMISQMQKDSSVKTKWRLLELQFGIKIQWLREYSKYCDLEHFQALGHSFSLPVPKHIVLLHSLLQGGIQKLKYPKVAFSVVLKKASTWSDLIKLQLLEECYEYGSRLHPSWPAFYFKPFRPPTTWFLAISTDTW